MKFNIRIEDLEVRSHNTALTEIVRWFVGFTGNEYCCTIAYWNKTSDGYDLKFVGDRPFEVNPELFMRLAKYGQEILNEVK